MAAAAKHQCDVIWLVTDMEGVDSFEAEADRINKVLGGKIKLHVVYTANERSVDTVRFLHGLTQARNGMLISLETGEKIEVKSEPKPEEVELPNKPSIF